MQLIRGIHNIREDLNGCVLTIGNFDGVHRGHKRVIDSLVKTAKANGLASAVMVFEPQPQEVFNPKAAPARLTRLRDKYSLLKSLGVDKLICVKFSMTFASMSAEAFIEDLLVKKLVVKYLIIGDDFRFGANRRGDFSMLVDYGKKHDFVVTDTESCKLSGCRVSSTEIRQLLLADKLNDAKDMLGRDYSIHGKVIHGDKKGRTIGFPTANVLLQRHVSPVSGVYAVMVSFEKWQFAGVANIGSRPTVSGNRQQLEVHLFGYKGSLYGKHIEVTVKDKLREEKRFSSFDELTHQIKLDAEQAQQFFASQGIEMDNEINE